MCPGDQSRVTAEKAELNVCSGKKKPALTCVVEESSDEGAVLKEGVGGGDVLEVTLFEQGVLEYHGLHLEIQKPTENQK